MALSPYAGQLADYILGGQQGPIPDQNPLLPPPIASPLPPPVPGQSVPELAQSILASLQAGPDARLAQNDVGPVPSSVLDVATRGPAAPAPTGSLAHSPAPPIGSPVPIGKPGGPPAPVATGGGPGEAAGPQTSPLDVVRAVQAEAGQGTPGSASFGSSSSVTKGIPFTPEDRAGLQASRDRFESKVNDVAQQASDHYATQLGDLRARHAAAAEEQTRAQMNEQAKGFLVQQRQYEQKQAVDAVLNDEAPRPFGGNVWAGILAAIAQGAGAYSAAINKTRNFAADIINDTINHDMQRWQANQGKKRFGAEQADRMTGQAQLDLRDATTNREIVQRRLLDNEYQQLQTGEKNADKLEKYALMRADNQQRLDNLEIQMQREAHDRVTIGSHSSATGGTPGRPLSLLDASVKATKEGAITPEEARQVRGQGNASDAEGRTAAEQKIKGPSDSLLDVTNRLLPQMGATVNQKTGEWEVGTGDMIGTHVPFSTSKHARDELVNMLAPDIATIRKGGGAAPSEGEIAHVRKELETSSPEQFGMAINLAVKRAQAVKHQKILHSKRQVSGGDEAEE